MLLQQIVDFFEQFAPSTLALDWDNVGLLIDCKTDVSSVLLTLDITTDSINYAAANGFGLIISHHPLFLSPIKKLTCTDTAFLLVKNNISALCLHTNLDATIGGVNDLLCEMLNIKNTTPFCGMGRIGDVQATSMTDFSKTVALALKSPVFVVNTEKTIKKVAVIGGGAGEYVTDAAAQNADCYVTGEVKNHEAVIAKELCIGCIAAGHFATENPIMSKVLQLLSQNFPQIKAEIYESCVQEYVFCN